MFGLGATSELQSEYTFEFNRFLRRNAERLFLLGTCRPGTLAGNELAGTQGLTFAWTEQPSEQDSLTCIELLATAIPCSRYAAC
jgi:hypothetical protein